MSSNMSSSNLSRIIGGVDWSQLLRRTTKPGTVKIVCGLTRDPNDDKVTYYVQLQSVCQGSSYFRAALLNQFHEAEARIIELDSTFFDPQTLHQILRYLHGLPSLTLANWSRPENHPGLMELHRQASYLRVKGITGGIIQSLKAHVNSANFDLGFYRHRDPAVFEQRWRRILTDAQFAFSKVNTDMSDDCDAIREVYMDFLHRNHGLLMSLGEPFADFMRKAPDLTFFMMKDAHENRDRSILSPEGFFSTCTFCGSTIGNGAFKSFFILVTKTQNDVRYICRKVACRRKVKKTDF